MRIRRPFPLALLGITCSVFLLCGAAIAVSRDVAGTSNSEGLLALRAEIEQLLIERDAAVAELASLGPLQWQVLPEPPDVDPPVMAYVAAKPLPPPELFIVRTRVSARDAWRDAARTTWAAGLPERAKRVAAAFETTLQENQNPNPVYRANKSCPGGTGTHGTPTCLGARP